jgi:hypothetical protein
MGMPPSLKRLIPIAGPRVELCLWCGKEKPVLSRFRTEVVQKFKIWESPIGLFQNRRREFEKDELKRG